MTHVETVWYQYRSRLSQAQWAKPLLTTMMDGVTGWLTTNAGRSLASVATCFAAKKRGIPRVFQKAASRRRWKWPAATF